MNEAVLKALKESLKRIQEERINLRGGTAGVMLFCKEEEVRLAIEVQEAIIEGAKE